MSTSKNKAGQRRIWEESFNKGNLAIIPELIAPDYIFRSPLGIELKGPEGFKQLISMTHTAFPDVHVTVNEMVAEGDKVVSCFTLKGTFKGEMMGIAPTGKRIEITGAVIVRWVGGKEVEALEFIDTLSWYRQLGIPIPPGQ